MNKTDTKPKAELQRYWNPQGGGVDPHDAGLLYLRDDVDAVIAALRAERNALRAEVERLRAEAAKLFEALQDAVTALDDHNKTGDMMQGWWVQAARAALAKWEAAQK